MRVGGGGRNQREVCEGRQMGLWDGIEEHRSKCGGEMAGSDSNGVECSGDPDESGWRGNGVAELVIVGEIVRVEAKVLMKTKGACKRSRGNPVRSTLVCNPLPKSRLRVI